MTVGADSTVQETVGTIISLTINGQTLNYGVNGNITLPDMTTVHIVWGSGGPQTITTIITGTPG
jgi:hypothetical protein